MLDVGLSLHSKNTNLQKLSVFLGKSAINETDVEKEQKFTVEQLVLHAGYSDSKEYNNDIGMCVGVYVCECVGLCVWLSVWVGMRVWVYVCVYV